MDAMASQGKSEEKRLPKGFFEGQLIQQADKTAKKKGASEEDGRG